MMYKIIDINKIMAERWRGNDSLQNIKPLFAKNREKMLSVHSQQTHLIAHASKVRSEGFSF